MIRDRVGCLAVLVLLFPGALGCRSSAPPGSAPSPVSITGTWSGTASDNSGPGQMIWQITQTGTSFSGTLTMTDATTNIAGRGSVSGSLSGASIHFSIAIPASGFDAPYGSCSADASGDAQVSAAVLSGTFSGTNSCTGAVTSGQLTLTRS